MTVKERKRVNRLKYLFIVLGIMELVMLIACINTGRTDEYGRPVGRNTDYGYEDMSLGSFSPNEEPDAPNKREQRLRDAESRNSAMLGLDASPNEIIP